MSGFHDLGEESSITESIGSISRDEEIVTSRDFEVFYMSLMNSLLAGEDKEIFERLLFAEKYMPEGSTLHLRTLETENIESYYPGLRLYGSENTIYFVNHPDWFSVYNNFIITFPNRFPDDGDGYRLRYVYVKIDEDKDKNRLEWPEEAKITIEVGKWKVEDESSVFEFDDESDSRSEYESDSGFKFERLNSKVITLRTNAMYSDDYVRITKLPNTKKTFLFQKAWNERWYFAESRFVRLFNLLSNSSPKSDKRFCSVAIREGVSEGDVTLCEPVPYRKFDDRLSQEMMEEFVEFYKKGALSAYLSDSENKTNIDAELYGMWFDHNKKINEMPYLSPYDRVKPKRGVFSWFRRLFNYEPELKYKVSGGGASAASLASIAMGLSVVLASSLVGSLEP